MIISNNNIEGNTIRYTKIRSISSVNIVLNRLRQVNECSSAFLYASIESLYNHSDRFEGIYVK